MENQKRYDVIVIGGGPAGLTGAMYLARAKKQVLVLEKQYFGGQIALTDEVVNYPGIERISGAELTNVMKRQAAQFGAEFLQAEVKKASVNGEEKQVETGKGILRSRGLLIASGSHPKRVGFEGETEFTGKGVSYCAVCDGAFYKGKPVVVIGGGLSAVQESLFLTRFASHVTMLIRRDRFSCPEALAKQVIKHENITVLFQCEAVRAEGNELVTRLWYRDQKSRTLHSVSSESGIGVFVFAGYEPETSFLKGQLPTDKNGYLLTDETGNLGLPLVYAAGDVRKKQVRQVTTAVGDGAAAAAAMTEELG